jgi:hypothetical protein
LCTPSVMNSPGFCDLTTTMNLHDQEDYEIINYRTKKSFITLLPHIAKGVTIR